jgi:hypothetical protein
LDDVWTDTVPFLAGSDGTPRPYLWLMLHGPNGGGAERILGLADSGADKTVLPLEYAELLGYRDEDLEDLEVGQVHGTTRGRDAQRPCQAWVVGHPDLTFEMSPIFVDTFEALWGRADLMNAYRVSISERRQELGLHLPA